jgi:hypothetical protein
MKSLIIHPVNEKEFNATLSQLPEFGKGRNLLTLKDDDTIGFVFLMKAKSESVGTPAKTSIKKTSR